MKKLFLSVLLLGNLYGAMDITTAWEMTQKKSSGLNAAKDDMDAAKLKRESVKSMYLPNISLSANYTHMDKAIDLDTSGISALMAAFSIPFPSTLDLSKEDVFLADLQMLWPLYTGGKIDAAQDIYAALLDESKAKLSMKKDKEFLKLVKYYYGYVVAKAYYKTRKEATNALQIHYENAKKMYEEGQIAKVELLNAEVKRDSAKIEEEKAEDKLSITKKALFIITGAKEEPISKLFVYDLTKELSYYEKAFEQKSTTLKIFDAKSKQSASLVAIQKAAFKPEVMAYADYNLYRDDSPLMESLPNWFAGVIVKIDLLARKDRSQEVSVAKLQNAKVVALKEEARESLKILLQKSYDEMLSSLKEYKSLDSSLKLAKENYRLRSLSFKEGLATSSEVVDAELFLQSVKTKRLNAAYNFILKLSQVLVLSGEREEFFTIIKEAEVLE